MRSVAVASRSGVLAVVVAIALGQGCSPKAGATDGPAAPPDPPTRSLAKGAASHATRSLAKDAATHGALELQGSACVGENGASNVVPARDGQCLCWDPPRGGGTPPPFDPGPEFEGTFLCRPGAAPPDPSAAGVDARGCPRVQPQAGDACDDHAQLLRNDECHWIAPDMRTLVNERCTAGHWVEVPQEEIYRRLMNQP